MGTNIVVATLEFTVGVCESSDSAIELELNADKNCNKSCFAPGNTVYFKCFAFPESLLSALELYSTVGTPKLGSYHTEDLEEYVVMNNFQASVNKYINSGLSTSWFGKAPTGIGTVINNPSHSKALTCYPNSGGCSDEDENSVPGVLKVNYTARWREITVVVSGIGNVSQELPAVLAAFASA